MSFDALPDELIENIVLHLTRDEGSSTRASLARTSKRLYRITWPIMWETIGMTTERYRLFSLAYQLMKNPERAKSVSKFMCFEGPDEGHKPIRPIESFKWFRKATVDKDFKPPRDAVQVFENWKASTGFVEGLHNYSFRDALDPRHSARSSPLLLCIILWSCPSLTKIGFDESALMQQTPCGAATLPTAIWRWPSLQHVQIGLGKHGSQSELTIALLDSMRQHRFRLPEMTVTMHKSGNIRHTFAPDDCIQCLTIVAEYSISTLKQYPLFDQSVIMPNLRELRIEVRDMGNWVFYYSRALQNIIAPVQRDLQILRVVVLDYNLRDWRKNSLDLHHWSIYGTFRDFRLFRTLWDLKMSVALLVDFSLLYTKGLIREYPAWSAEIHRLLEGQLSTRLPRSLKTLTIYINGDLEADIVCLGLSGPPSSLMAQCPHLTHVDLASLEEDVSPKALSRLKEVLHKVGGWINARYKGDPL